VAEPHRFSGLIPQGKPEEGPIWSGGGAHGATAEWRESGK